MFATALLLCAMAGVGFAQPGHVFTDAEYTRAVHQLSAYTEPLVDHAVRSVTWLPEDRFWYADAANSVPTVMLVDARKGSKAALDAAKQALGTGE